jgi:hypothetical protein
MTRLVILFYYQRKPNTNVLKPNTNVLKPNTNVLNA